MTLREYEILYAVFQERSMSKAANFLLLSQPTVSNVIKKLEADYKCPLFIRAKNDLIPTEICQQLYIIAEQILSLNSQTSATLLTGGHTACRAGFYESFSDGPLIPLLEHFEKNDISLTQVVVGTRDLLVREVKNRQLDFCICDYHLYDSELDAFPIFKDTLTFVCSKDYPCESVLKFDELALHPIIIREKGSGDYHTLQQHFAERRYPFKPWVISSNSEFLFKLAAAGHGIVCCSKTYYSKTIRDDRLRELQVDGASLWKTRYILAPKNNGLRPKIKHIIDETADFLTRYENKAF